LFSGGDGGGQGRVAGADDYYVILICHWGTSNGAMNFHGVKGFKLFSVTYNNLSDTKPQDKCGDA
jgi:hypothetical protein